MFFPITLSLSLFILPLLLLLLWIDVSIIVRRAQRKSVVNAKKTRNVVYNIVKSIRIYFDKKKNRSSPTVILIFRIRKYTCECIIQI
jgi:hypothetical protein